ncbi:substrate-binding periplasmic protein [Psychrobacter pygoscelis]|uniref:substrate-binding periplasmic protein n=1 Tax=Psychrobacter pygoscelis TaxID=2488563 RepID=UPI00103D3926|nr:transporter substrate-binding domain-containing protein [Psychrobacter pygoscelis]
MRTIYKALPFVLGVSLFGCDQKLQTEEQSTVSKEQNSSETDFVSELPDSAPVVKVGTEANYAPYEFKDEYGNVTGFDLELIRAIGEDQGFKVEVYNDPWNELFDNLDSNSRDMIAAGVTYSKERSGKYLLSDDYAPLPSTLVYLDDTLNIQSLDGINGLRVGVLSNSAPYRLFTENDYSLKSLEQYPTTFLAVQAMAQDKVDVVAGDSGVLRYTMNDLPTLNPKYFDYESLSDNGARKVFLVDKEQPELLHKVNLGLEGLKNNGKYGELTTKWFGKDLTKNSQAQQKMLDKNSVAQAQ